MPDILIPTTDPLSHLRSSPGDMPLVSPSLLVSLSPCLLSVPSTIAHPLSPPQTPAVHCPALERQNRRRKKVPRGEIISFANLLGLAKGGS